MNEPRPMPRVLLIDSNVYFVKRMTDALVKEGFQVMHHPEATYAMTMIEWNPPDIILCATELREMGAFEIVSVLRGDPKTAKIPVLAIGSGADKGPLDAYRAGCDDYIDRRRNPADIASHLLAFLQSSKHGFQSTELLGTDDTSFSGNLEHLDLPGIMQMLDQSRKTGALHINAGETDAVLFYESGEILHAECGKLVGDPAVIQIVKNCQQAGRGTYKLVTGTTAGQRTVQRRSMDLLLDALREFDEAGAHTAEREAS
jgi:two-component system, cell cycle response regulator DivK